MPPVITAGKMLQWLVVTLLGFAVVMVTSAGVSIAGDGITIEGFLGSRVVLYALGAMLVMSLASHVDVKRIAGQKGLFFNKVYWVVGISVGLCLLVYVPGIGKPVNGSYRWIRVGPESWNFSFQPSELAKWVLVIGVAWWGAKRAEGVSGFWKGLLPPLVVVGGVCGFIAIEDLGTGILIGCVAVVMLVAAGAKLWQMGLLMAPAVAGIVYLVWVEEYRMRRIMTFLEPWKDPQGDGYHLTQSLATIASGEGAGRGLGNSVHKFGYLPEDTTDFLFAVICNELGIAGACVVIGLFGGIFFVGYGIIRDTKHCFGRLLALGVMATIGLQALINMAVVTGLMPTKGIALPFLSNGGTGWIMGAVAVGLVVALDRRNVMERLGVIDGFGEAEVVGGEGGEESSDGEGGEDVEPVVSISAAAYG